MTDMTNMTTEEIIVEGLNLLEQALERFDILDSEHAVAIIEIIKGALSVGSIMLAPHKKKII